MEEYYTIGETADLLGITTKTLRNWDKENIFVPDLVLNDNHRRYSKIQIEAKTGKSISILKHPILALKMTDIEKIRQKLAEINIQTTDVSIRENYEVIYRRLIRDTYAIRRINQECVANFILASPEISSMFEVATAGFAPASPSDDSDRIRYIGIVNNRWKIYCTYLLEPNECILATEIEGSPQFDQEYAVRYLLSDFNFI